MKILLLARLPFALALATLAIGQEDVGRTQSQSAPSPSSETLGPTSYSTERTFKPISSAKLRLSSAADHLEQGAKTGAANAVLGPAYMLYGGYKGARYAAHKTKEHWKDGSYHKAAGHAVMVAARPASSLVTAPAAMIAGIGTAAAGTVGAAGSVLKIAKDAAAKPFRRKESDEQKTARYVENAKKLDKKLVRKVQGYRFPLRTEAKIYNGVSAKDRYR